MRGLLERVWAPVLGFVQTLFRMVPQPSRPRLIEVGRPGRSSPVLVTTNCSLTVRRVVRALRGVDCYLLVAPAQGINVWCGSVGGHFTVDSVLSILQTSGIESKVDHRSLVLPQLAAPSIDPRELKKRSGWGGVFGPVAAADIPRFLAAGRRIAADMRQVGFPVATRLEMALAMTGSIVLRFSLLPLVIWGVWGVLFFAAAVLALSAAELWRLQSRRQPAAADCESRPRLGFASQNLFAALLPLLPLPLMSLDLIRSRPTELSLTGIGLAAAALILVRNAAPGYAPYKQCSYSKTFYGFEPISIRVETEQCIGCVLCERVCPVDCFEETSASPRLFDIVRGEACVECGACLLQCPTGAVVNAAADAPTLRLEGWHHGPQS